MSSSSGKRNRARDADGIPSHRCRIFLIVKMSGYEKCQHMSSPSSGACLAGLIKSSLAVIIRSDLSVCLVILGKKKEKEKGSNIC